MSTATIARTHNDIPEIPVPAPSVPVKKKKKRAPMVLGTLVLIAAAVGVYLYISSRGKEQTDDAQVEGHVANVAARVAGQVKRVLVEDNQQVKKGDVLVELDDADLAARFDSANADLLAAQASLHAAQAQLALTAKQIDANLAVARGGVAQATAVNGSTQAQIDQARADVLAAESRANLAHTELARTQKLTDGGAVPLAELDKRRDDTSVADATVTQAKARLASALANVANSQGTSEAARGRLLGAQTGPEQVELAKAQVEQAEAKVVQAQKQAHIAELNLGYTKIRAELDGYVAKRTVEPGQMVGPERALMALVGTTDTWVVANFKETQMSGIKPGQRVHVTIDSYGGSFDGKVESIQAGTGARFSLLPPDNASGNFTKVTQRVPVRIAVPDRRGLAFRPGMSADVTVYTAE